MLSSLVLAEGVPTHVGIIALICSNVLLILFFVYALRAANLLFPVFGCFPARIRSSVVYDEGATLLSIFRFP